MFTSLRMLGGLAVDGTVPEPVVFPVGKVLLGFGVVFFDANAMVSLSAMFILGQLPLNDFMPSARPLKVNNVHDKENSAFGGEWIVVGGRENEPSGNIAKRRKDGS